MPDKPKPPSFPAHGDAQLPALTVDAYNAELRDGDGFLGDKASNGAFKAMIARWRDRLEEVDEDPLADVPEAVSRKRLDQLLTQGAPDQAALVHAVIEEFAAALAQVTTALLALKEWRGTEAIVVGGGLRASRVGEIAIARCAMRLKDAGLAVDMRPIRHDPDEAGLIGALQLAPSWVFAGHDAILAVDIGGSNFRAGVVQSRLKKAADLTAACAFSSELWRHADDKPKRDDAIERLGEMLRGQAAAAAKGGLKLAPFIGVGVPGRLRDDGGIEQGAQNLPGNWESSRFNLPKLIHEAIPEIDGHPTMVVAHNDAVVQGLSEAPFMRGVKHWGVLTIGTGLGNARFTNNPE